MKKLAENTSMPKLQELGFVAEVHPSWRLWSLPAVEAETHEDLEKPDKAENNFAKIPGLGRLNYPWKLTSCELVERKDQLSLDKLAVDLDKALLVENLRALVRKYFGPRTRFDCVMTDAGDLWCVYEFTRPGARDKSLNRTQTSTGVLLPQGCGGFNLRLGISGARISVIICDYFGFGYLPSNFASVPHRMVSEALGLRSATTFLPEAWAQARTAANIGNIYELRFSPLETVLIPLAARDAAALQACKQIYEELQKKRPTYRLRVQRTAERWQVIANSEQNLESAWKQVPPAPVEVLEARERDRVSTSIDGMILDGKLSKALTICVQAWRENPQSLHSMRRLAVLGLSGRMSEGVEFIDLALHLEPKNKLFLSYAVNQALAEGNQSRVLMMLSRLGQELVEAIPNGDQLACLSIVLPELLGDAWAAEDRRKAEDAYQRILQGMGDLPRVLRKLISLARTSGQAQQEIAYLGRLSSVERRRVELAKIYYRLAELRHQLGGYDQEACQLALKSLAYDRGHERAALLAAELLVKQEKSEEAIELLDGVLYEASANMAAKARGRLLVEIARIWDRSLHRSDLAETRFEQAMAIDRFNIMALQELERLYRHREHTSGLVGVLEAQFDVYEQSGDGQALRQVFDELVNLYRSVVGQPTKAYELYQRLLVSVSIEPEEIDRVLAWRDVEIDWHDLYQKISEKIAVMSSGSRRARLLCRLADIAREKIDDSHAATEHLSMAVADGWIDGASFQFLVERYLQERSYALLVRAYEYRLKQVESSERQRLLLEMLALPDGLSHSQRDHLAVQVYKEDVLRERALFERFNFYKDVDDLDAIEALLSSLVGDASLSQSQKTHWLKTANVVLEDCAQARKAALIDANCRKLVELGEDEIEIARGALKLLQGAGESKYWAFYAGILIRRDVLPDLDERTLLKLFSGMEHELALFHRLMSMQDQGVESKATHARMAASLFAKIPGQELQTEHMLMRMMHFIPCSNADMEQLADLVMQSGHYEEYAKALEKQVDYEDLSERKCALLEQIGEIYREKVLDVHRARITFLTALQHSSPSNQLHLHLKIAYLAASVDDVGGERQAMLDAMRHPDAIDDLKALESIIDRLLSLGESPNSLIQVVKIHLDAAMSRHDLPLARRWVRALIDKSLGNAELYYIELRAAVEAKESAFVVEAFCGGLRYLTEGTQLKTYLNDVRQELAKVGSSDVFVACLEEGLQHNFDQLGRKARHEMLVQYGQLLFETDARRAEALTSFLEAYSSDAHDLRVWMPLYFLLSEFGSTLDRQRHLQSIIPKLEKDPRPLKALPVTIESLRAELEELKRQDVSAIRLVYTEKVYTEDAIKPPVKQGAVQIDSLAVPLSQGMDLQYVAGEAPGFSLQTVEGSSVELDSALTSPPEDVSENYVPSFMLAPQIGAEIPLTPIGESAASEGSENELAATTPVSLEKIAEDEAVEEIAKTQMEFKLSSPVQVEQAAPEVIPDITKNEVPSLDFSAGQDSVANIVDWRTAVLKGEFQAGLTLQLLKQAFASDTEKHIALQAVALIAGECHHLQQWHWRVWRKPEEYGYPTSGKERFPSALSSSLLHTPLYKLIIASLPLLIKIFHERFSLQHVAQKLDMKVEQLEKLRKELSWQDGILRDVGLSHFNERLADRGYKVFSLPGLGSEIFYEGAHRHFYIDEFHYKRVPPSHLLHRLLSLLWSTRVQYFVPLALHPSKQVLPTLIEIHEYLNKSGVAGWTQRLTARSRVSQLLASMDTASLKAGYQKVGLPRHDDLVQLWDAMRLHVYRLVLAETLDLVGLLEAITNRDLLKQGKHGEIFALSPQVRALLDFVTKLKL